MSLDPITSMNRISQLTEPNKTSNHNQTASALDDFGHLLSRAIDSLSRKENVANSAVADLAAGEDVELHQVMLAMQEADISFQLALQVRNKIVEAYQEITRMQI